VTGASLGGTRKVTLNTEFIAPFPGAGNDRTLRCSAFVDVGNVYGEARRSARCAARFRRCGPQLDFAPGPAALGHAQPVRKFAPGDRIQRFQFQIGTSF
jgi:outer membrane protein insertion porin family